MQVKYSNVKYTLAIISRFSNSNALIEINCRMYVIEIILWDIHFFHFIEDHRMISKRDQTQEKFFYQLWNIFNDLFINSQRNQYHNCDNNDEVKGFQAKSTTLFVSFDEGREKEDNRLRSWQSFLKLHITWYKPPLDLRTVAGRERGRWSSSALHYRYYEASIKKSHKIKQAPTCSR